MANSTTIAFGDLHPTIKGGEFPNHGCFGAHNSFSQYHPVRHDRRDERNYFTRELKNAAEDLGNITKELKKNAIRHNIPIILISHTRKAPDSHTTKTGINDLRGSSYIAQDADIVLMVERNMKDFPEDIIVTLGKNRNRYGCKVGTFYNMKFQELRVIEPSINPRFDK